MHRRSARAAAAAAALLLLLACASAAASTPPSCAAPQPQAEAVAYSRTLLNVHIVAHTHDDVGWLKTVDQYYYGANETIQVAAVQHILDSVITALALNPRRRFVYSEMAFFSRWWAEQTPESKVLTRALVASGRLAFVGGGWVMHDEATSHYRDQIESMSRGHRFIAAEFGVSALPKVAWQLDPFGHGATQAALFGVASGAEGLFVGRVDDGDLMRRRQDRALEMLWKPVGCPGLKSGLFTGILGSGNYGPPDGFNWDYPYGTDPPMMDDPALEGYNVPERLASFHAALDERAAWFRGSGAGGHLMLTFGTDFTFGAAGAHFKNVDKLLAAANAAGRAHVFYSTPHDYLLAKRAAVPESELEIKTDDFFPYSDGPHMYWTGFFTSRPGLKRHVRYSAETLSASRILHVLWALASPPAPKKAAAWVASVAALESLAEAVCVAQHHDAVTGTAKQHVTLDYGRRLSAGAAAAAPAVARAVAEILGGPGRGAATLRTRLSDCPLLNASVCPATAAVAPGGVPLAMIVVNPLPRPRAAFLRLPVSLPGNADPGPGFFTVLVLPYTHGPATPTVLPSQLLPPVKQGPGEGGWALAVAVQLPPLGVVTVLLSAGAPSSPSQTPTPPESGIPESGIPESGFPEPGIPEPGIPESGIPESGVSESLATVSADGTTLTLRPAAAPPDAPPSVTVTSTLGYYEASAGAPGGGRGEGQAAGAYILRPSTGVLLPMGDPHPPETHAGPVVIETRAQWGDWGALTTRVWAAGGGLAVEQEWAVGPVPIGDGLGKEAVLARVTSVGIGAVLATDAGGRGLVHRPRPRRETWNVAVTEGIAGNVYPCADAAALLDPGTPNDSRIAGALSLGVVTDRAQGVASLGDSRLDFFVHRRLTADDGRGVGEALSEPAEGGGGGGLVARGRQWLLAATAAEFGPALAAAREAAAAPPLVLFAAAPGGAAGWAAAGIRGGAAPYGGSADALPPRVRLLSLEPAGATAAIVRLEHHVAGTPESLSESVTADLGALFPGTAVTQARPRCMDSRLESHGLEPRTQVEELLLTGAAPRPVPTGWAAWVHRTAARAARGWGSPRETRVALSPMEVRTFRVAWG